MTRRILTGLFCAVLLCIVLHQSTAQAQEPRAFGRQWGHTYSNHNWERFYHYPYVYYPQNFWGSEYYRSAESLYYRYPPEMQIPVYNRRWQNYYPQERIYHSGHHFQLDIF